jgi:hypothetical protein
LPIIENNGSDGSLDNVLAKNKFHTATLGLLCPKTTIILAAASVVFLVIEKTVFFLSLTQCTDAALYCKNDLVSSQDTLSTYDLITASRRATAEPRCSVDVLCF